MTEPHYKVVGPRGSQRQYYLPLPSDFLERRRRSQIPKYMQRYFRADKPTRQVPSRPPTGMTTAERRRWFEKRQRSVPGALRPWVRSSVQRRGFVQQKLPPSSQRGPWQRITSLNPAEVAAREQAAREYMSNVAGRLAIFYPPSVAAELISRNRDEIDEGFVDGRDAYAIAVSIMDNEPAYQSRRLSRQHSRKLSQVRSRLWSHYSRNAVAELMMDRAATIDHWIRHGWTAREIAEQIYADVGSDPGIDFRSQRGKKEPAPYQGRKIYTGPLPTCDPNKEDPCEGWYETRDCAAYFVAGREADWIAKPMYRGEPVPAARYGVCLTNTQLARLMRAKHISGDQFGCGAFACVWPKGNRTIKFTHDPEDVGAFLTARGIRHIKRFYKVYRLVDSGTILRTGQSTPVWAMVGEDVPKIANDDWRYSIVVSGLPVGALSYDFEQWQSRGRFPEDYQPRPDVRRSAKEDANCERRGPACEKFVDQFIDTWAALARRGIVFMDAHAGNIGVDAKGNWKIIDMGLSRSDIPEEFVEDLRGLRRGIQRRSRDKRARRGMIAVAAVLGLILILPVVPDFV
ncbi:MAG: hypothetical protein JSV86_17135 [Gemmatimonadota bacterium]|nr:MAG: hypothetical protein JSV86_17135 [Gemmatimonadota bacterium]